MILFWPDPQIRYQIWHSKFVFIFLIQIWPCMQLPFKINKLSQFGVDGKTLTNCLYPKDIRSNTIVYHWMLLWFESSFWEIRHWIPTGSAYRARDRCHEPSELLKFTSLKYFHIGFPISPGPLVQTAPTCSHDFEPSTLILPPSSIDSPCITTW